MHINVDDECVFVYILNTILFFIHFSFHYGILDKTKTFVAINNNNIIIQFRNQITCNNSLNI